MLGYWRDERKRIVFEIPAVAKMLSGWMAEGRERQNRDSPGWSRRKGKHSMTAGSPQLACFMGIVQGAYAGRQGSEWQVYFCSHWQAPPGDTHLP